MDDSSVDLNHLRFLCKDGIPNEPRQLRPIIYSLLMGTLPAQKLQWEETISQQRQKYYALVDDIVSTDIPRITADVERHFSSYPILRRPSRPSDDSDRPSRRIFTDQTPQITVTSSTSSTVVSSSDPPETHAEAIIRLLAVINGYDPAYVPIVIPLYLAYARNPSSYAEEEVYWMVTALLERTITDTQMIGSRLKWADEHLYSILLHHELDPATPLYTFRWMSSIFAADVSHIYPIWDVIFAATDLPEAMISMACAILLAGKKQMFRPPPSRGLWEEPGDGDFIQALTYLRNIPAQQVEPIVAAYSALCASSPPVSQPRPADISVRLATLALSVGSTPPVPRVPKALKLQDKARRASGSTPLRKTSTSSEATLSPPTSSLYRIGSRDMPRRALVYDHMLALAVGLKGRRTPNLAPLACLIRHYSIYPHHQPLNRAQNALLAVGSGLMGVADTRRGDLVATLSESTASTFLPTLHAATIAHAEGRQIMRDRPTVSSKTVDLGHLRTLQRGTLGREYVEWLGENDLTPDTRENVRYIDSPTLAYTMLRYRQTHDLYHTLFSLPPTLPHELSLKVVELSNMSLPVAGLSSAFGPFRLSNARRAVWLNDWAPWALRVGREGRSLVGVYWEKRWEQGLGDLRRELGVYRNDMSGVESRWRGYRELRERERGMRRTGEWIRD